jgi:hypothetical protein
MELLEGETLRQRLERGSLAWRQTVEIGLALAEGMAAAHAKGISHRDRKPENPDYALACLAGILPGVRGAGLAGGRNILSARPGIEPRLLAGSYLPGMP